MNRFSGFFLTAACLLLAVPSFSIAQSGSHFPGFPSETTIDTTIDVSVAAKWNMISVPLIATAMHKDSLYPSSISNAFYYDHGYTADNDLVMGVGYWLKFDSAESIPLFGATVHQDSIDVVTGWNLVGSISDPVSVGAITTLPSGITLSRFWKYDHGYQNATAIVPGGGYWVKASADGAIVLDGGQAVAPRAAVDPFAGLHSLVIEDSRGMKQTLLFGEATAKTAGEFTDMPPPPPPGVFDARFADGNWAELYAGGGGSRFAVRVTSAAWPVTVRWEIDPRDRGEFVLNESVRMTGKGSLVIAQEGPISVRAGSSAVPASYALMQNYPNPFNPVTTITYALPENAPVKLTVYDLLGREVGVLAEGTQTAGVHDVVFDAAAYPTGIYFYRLEAGSFTATRKLVIMK